MTCGNLYGVFDRKAGYFINVFVSSNDDTAKRSFENLFFTVEDTVFNLCKNDFSLAKICELINLPGCNGDSILVKPTTIMLAADISDYLIKEKRENGFMNFMRSVQAKFTDIGDSKFGPGVLPCVSPDYAAAKDEIISEEEWAEAEEARLSEERNNNG